MCHMVFGRFLLEDFIASPLTNLVKLSVKFAEYYI